MQFLAARADQFKIDMWRCPTVADRMQVSTKLSKFSKFSNFGSDQRLHVSDYPGIKQFLPDADLQMEKV